MRKDAWTTVLVCALFGLLAADGLAQTGGPVDEVVGVVARVDERHGVVIMDDGRMLRITPATVIMAGGRTAGVGSLQPGTMVVIRSAERVALRGGQYVVLSDSPAASGGGAVGAVRTRTFGRVKDVDRDGDVRIETQTGTFHVRVSPDAARTLKDGDTATVEVIITPPAPTVR
jgi:hypothetical protein